MKKYFFILSLLCLALVSCEKDEPEPVKDPLDYTLVHITKSSTYSGIEITGVFTDGYNIGIYPGNYYIKKNSTISINWTYYDTDYYYSEYIGDYSESFTVGNAQEIWINVSIYSAYVINGD